jgi:small subunit ribosomal protein S2
LARRNAYKLVYIKERIAHLKDLEQQEASGTFDLLTKKEAAPKRINKITPSLRWYKTMGGLPDVAIIIDQKREMTAIENVRN